MAEDDSKITYIAETDFRNERKKFGIKKRDRSRHVYIVGKTGVGKTTLLENMAIQDITSGEGVCIVDPHGDFAEKMLNFIPVERIDDVLYFAPHDLEYPVAFNIMEDIGPEQRHLVSAGLLGVFKKVWPDVWSARMEYILSNAILALLEYPDSTLLGINRMLSDKAYRNKVVENIKDPAVKAFWVDEFANYSDRLMADASAAIQNKVGQFSANPLIRNIIGQPKSSFNLRDIMDNKKILLVNLSKGRMGEENSRLIGAMLVTKIYLAAMSRVEISELERSDFNLFVDEFQNFATDSFAGILAEARKYRLNLVLAHQYIAQMEDDVRDAVIGNVGTMVTFRLGAQDAELFEKEFVEEFTVGDIVSLGFASIYLRLMIDGVASRPFSAHTLPPIQMKGASHSNEVIESSRKKYANPRAAVEEAILSWHEKDKDKSEKIIGGEPDKPKMFQARCAVCEDQIYIPFEPDGKRPVLCKKHRAKPEASKTPLKPVTEAVSSAPVAPINPAPNFAIVSDPPVQPAVVTPVSPPLAPPRSALSAKPSSVSHSAPVKFYVAKHPPRFQQSKPKKETISLNSLKSDKVAKTDTDSLKSVLDRVMGKNKKREEANVPAKKTLSEKPKTISLNELKSKNIPQNIQEAKKENVKAKSGIIKPGEKIKFD